MGVTPSLPLWLRSLERPTVAHIFGFRDPLGTAVAAWCRSRGVPYVLEPLGMFMPRVRKLRLKRMIDGSALRWLPQSAAAIVVTSEHERRQVVDAGGRADRIVIRGNGFPSPDCFKPASGALRDALGIGAAPLILYVGRIASGKGIEFLLETALRLPEVQLALVGPDDGHGISAAVENALSDPALAAGRIDCNRA